jgi:serine protease Do
MKKNILNSLVFGLSLVSLGAFAQGKTFWTEMPSAEKKAAQVKADALNEAIVGLAAKLSAAVVTVLTTSEVPTQQMVPDDFFEFFFGGPGGPRGRPMVPRSQKAQSLGSGFVIHQDGIIVTNSHVVRMGGEKLADSVKVKFMGDPSKSEGYDVEVVGFDPIVDTAVLKLKKKPAQKLAVVPFGNSDQIKVGEWVVAIGNPHGFSHSVTKGIVSALGRDVLPEISADFIQTDASINQGNSGGPLINIMGEVIGVNTAIDPRGQGLGFAIPINTAKRAIRDILTTGKATHGYAGVGLFPNFDEKIAKSLGLKDNDGALIEEVVPGQAADKAGLKAYDVVVKVGERRIGTNTDFQKAVRELDPGTTVKLDFLREAKLHTTQLTLGDLEKDILVAANNFKRGKMNREKPGAATGLPGVGLELEELTNETRSRWGLGRDLQGIIVSDVRDGSPADNAGLARGDIILEIARSKVPNVKLAEKILSKKGNYLLKVLRGPTLTLFTLKV